VCVSAFVSVERGVCVCVCVCTHLGVEGVAEDGWGGGREMRVRVCATHLGVKGVPVNRGAFLLIVVQRDRNSARRRDFGLGVVKLRHVPAIIGYKGGGMSAFFYL